MRHELKTWPIYFRTVLTGEKKFEYRTFDRPFMVGDELLLKEFLKTGGQYTGCEILVKVTYILHVINDMGVQCVIMSIDKVVL
jgi:hypothetical protein